MQRWRGLVLRVRPALRWPAVPVQRLRARPLQLWSHVHPQVAAGGCVPLPVRTAGSAVR